MMQGAQTQGMQSEIQGSSGFDFVNDHLSCNDSGFLRSIQDEDQAIRDRGLSVANAPLMVEMVLFFGIQLLVLSGVAAYHFYF